MESSTLPPDMLFEIFSRTDLKTIGRCRMVSKDLNLITYELSFMQAFRHKTKTIYGFFTQTSFSNKPMSQCFVSIMDFGTDSNLLSLKFLPCHAKIKVANKQGILLCVNENNTRRLRIPEYYVCKPSTEEWHHIPNPRTRYFTEGIGMVALRSDPLCYKIVRFSKPKCACVNYKSISYNALHCEIFSTETWAWKRLNDALLPWGEFLSWKPAVSTCGALHWLVTKNKIFAFFVDTESWITFDLPFRLCKENYFEHTKLVEYSGRLAMLCIEESSTHLWVMEDYDTKVWSKRQTMSIEAVHGASPLRFDNSDIALMQGFCSLILYNFKTCNSNVCKLRIDDDPNEVFPFQSDFE
jgi:F-box interacting protein